MLLGPIRPGSGIFHRVTACLFAMQKPKDVPCSRPYGATEHDVQKLHAPSIFAFFRSVLEVHEVLFPSGKTSKYSLKRKAGSPSFPSCQGRMCFLACFHEQVRFSLVSWEALNHLARACSRRFWSSRRRMIQRFPYKIKSAASFTSSSPITTRSMGRMNLAPRLRAKWLPSMAPPMLHRAQGMAKAKGTVPASR